MVWHKIQQLRPKNLKILPIAVVPQRDRPRRIILDLSFPVYLQDKKNKDPPKPKLTRQQPSWPLQAQYARLGKCSNNWC
jgi:hypothetical protein